MELEPKHLAPYFAHELKCMVEYEVNDNQIVNLLAMSNGMISVSKKSFPYSENLQLCDIKPILRPLSDLTKVIEVNGEKFIPWEWFNENPSENHCEVYEEWFEHIEDNNWASWVSAPYELTQKMIEWHFDVFGLIEKGLAININDL
jgi:DNA phosphorothioation-dependent restriction protein DptG